MRRTLLVLVALSVVLVGCTEDPEPRFEPTQETPSESETSEPEPDPEPWQVKSKAGAVAFAHHWVDVFNEAVTSGETAALVRLSADSCTACRNVIERVDSIYSSGGFYKTRGWRVLTASEPIGRAGERSFAVRIRRSAERFREQRGAAVQTNPASRATYRVELRWVAGEWSMARLVLFT